MNQVGWKRWRDAETALANGSDLDLATRDLPPRQAWILRATDAVERGDRDAFEALLPTAPGGEYSALVEVALSDPGDIDPTRLRARLKCAAVPNKPLPRLDLVRLFCVAHNGTLPARPASLARAVESRVVLRSALMVLSSKFKAYQVQADIAERSPRMARLWAAGVAQTIAPGNVRDCMSKSFPSLGGLPQAAWPDLEKPLATPTARRRRGGGARLEQFLNDPEHFEWSESCDEDVDNLERAGDPQACRETLGRLLDTMHRLIQSPMPVRAHELASAVARLIEAAPRVSHREVLMDQMQRLDLRLGWVQHALPGGAIEFLWDGLRSASSRMTPIERAHAAREILADPGAKFLPRPALTSLLASALRTPGDWRRETLPWLKQFGHSASVDQLAVALRGAPAPHRLRILGTLQALRGNLPAAMSLAAQLLAAGAVTEADGVVELAVVRRDESAAGRQSRRLQRRAILEYAKAGLRCEPTPGARALDLLLTPTAEDSNASSSKSLAPVIARRLRVQPQSPYRELCEYLHLLQMVGQGGQGADIFRNFGRWLRRAPAGEAIDSALCFCAAMSNSIEVIEFLLGDESGGEELRQPAAWLRSITQWLEHQPASAVEARAMTLVTTGDCTAMELVFWFDEVSDLPDSDGWDRVDALVGDEAFDGMPDLDALVAMFGIDEEKPF